MPSPDQALRNLAAGDITAVTQLRHVSREALDTAASTTGPYRLTLGALRRLVAKLPLDLPSQQHARVWAHFWIEGRLPQQDEGKSPAFDSDWDERFHDVMADILFTLWELGDESEGGWLTEERRARLLGAIDQAAEAQGP